MSKGIYRQGDVFIIPVDTVPVTTVVEPRKGDIILAEGEVTGHAHRITDKKAVMFRLGDQRYLITENESTVTHEEHGAITLPKGSYRIQIQREYTPGAVRNVSD